MNDPYSDAELLQLVCHGDGGAFAALVARYHARLVAYLTRVVRSSDLAEDFAQEAFYRVLLQACRYRELESSDGLIALLARTATNAASHSREHESRWKEISRMLQAEPDVDPSQPDRLAEAKEVDAKVQRALERMPEMYRTPLTLRELEGWSYEQIAQQCGITVGTVKSRISRDRSVLRRLLGPYWERRF